MTETVTETATETIRIRPARTDDVGAIKTLVAPLADQRILMAKETVAYYESLQEFRIAESEDGGVIGCGALHVMWEDLAEVRTLAASDAWRGKGEYAKAIADYDASINAGRKSPFSYQNRGISK